ncbi:F-box only protein 3 isoform X2 [Callorhinchus milii]|uniref:F-box only protein 3 isoform X2 n=1 Tax=Callorhinchus milii TaxID=7868 RepID=UPI001C3F889B|nr:F-box only protein 3 isoform X2 [Callorhinchus milii]
MAAVAVVLDLLPADPLLLVLSFLNYTDLNSCSCVCRRLHQLCNHDPMWKVQCHKYWLVSEEEKAEKKLSWKEMFCEYFSDLGRYIEHYAEVRTAWEELKAFLEVQCPRMIASLKVGVTEQQLNTTEEKIGFKLPNDYRCSLRIHNGQRLVVPGLMGSMALSSHYRSEDLLDVDTAAGGFQQRRGLKHCFPLTFCIHTGLSQYMALDDVEGRHRCEIFYHCADQMACDPSVVDMFITGASFTEWFTSYVHSVVSGGFPIIREQIFRIRIEMAKEAMPENACQLDSRYWKITNANGNVEEVQGPGVVGEFPVMRPGNVHEYTSCTTFTTPSGYMEGYYTFHRLSSKKDIFSVPIPRFHMRCPPSRGSAARQENDPNVTKQNEEPRGDGDSHRRTTMFVNVPGPMGRCLPPT